MQLHQDVHSIPTRRYSDLLENAGVKLKQKFAGVGYSERVRIMGDFSSRLYYVKRKESNKEVE